VAIVTPHSHAGSVGDEASRLLDAVQDWARSTFGEGESARMSTGSPECEWCPLCQLVAVLRGDRPEATEKIVAAGTAVMSALRSLLDSPAPEGQASPSEQPPSDQPPSAPQPSAPRVQHIDLDD
jgi:hypothetical protein